MPITYDDLRQLRTVCSESARVAVKRIDGGDLGDLEEGLLSQIAVLGLATAKLCTALIEGVQSGPDE